MSLTPTTRILHLPGPTNAGQRETATPRASPAGSGRRCQDSGAARPGTQGWFALCPEHRRLLIDDPGEFRRLWGALDPRSVTREPPPWAQ